MTVIYTMILFTTMILVCNVFPYYVLVAAALIASFFAIQYYYLNSVRYLKLLTSETNAYIFAHFSETLSGLSVIRYVIAFYIVLIKIELLMQKTDLEVTVRLELIVTTELNSAWIMYNYGLASVWTLLPVC